MKILPVASGKGGVGKSLIATNLSIALAQSGSKVLLADMDLGASNVHLMLGLPVIKNGIGNFLNKSVALEDIVIKTDYENLYFIPGDAEMPEMANIKAFQKQKIIRNIAKLDADYLIIDLGAGTGHNIIDFFLMSGHGILVSTPTLTSTLNAYLFLKNCIFRIMGNSFKKGTPAKKYLESLKFGEGSSLQKVYIPKFLETIKEKDPESYMRFDKVMSNFRPRLILNMLEDPEDGIKADKLRRSCKEYLGMELDHLGIVYKDALQDIALSSRIPILKYKPEAVLSQAVYRIADKIFQETVEDVSPLDIKNLEDNYKVAEMEAEVDFDSKIYHMQELLHSGALTTGDLIDTVKSQQYEITRLRKENNLLKSKLVKAAQKGFKV